MDLMPLVPLWCRAMQRMGTSKRSFVDFDQLMGATTGGFRPAAPWNRPRRGTAHPARGRGGARAQVAVFYSRSARNGQNAGRTRIEHSAF